MRRALVVVALALTCASCVGFVRTEGSSGPIAWRATDLESITQTIEGQPAETYRFALVVKNVSDRTIALTRIERTVFYPGGGDPGRGALDGRWELRPGGERRFQLGSYPACHYARGCDDRGGAQPLWRIVLLGVDDLNRPVESRFEIMLPPRAAPRYVQLAPAGLKGRLDSAAANPPEPPATQVVARVAASSLRIEAPVWQRGDEWQYRWQAGTSKNFFVWTVNREETVDGTPAYVIKTDGTREIFYRKADIATMRETVEGRVVLAQTPPRLRYAWPLEVGKSWEQTRHEERPTENQATDRTDAATVEAEETVTVPAGTFTTLKLVYRDKANGQIRYEEWYAPAVKSWVLLRERLTSGLRVRELTSYSLK